MPRNSPIFFLKYQWWHPLQRCHFWITLPRLPFAAIKRCRARTRRAHCTWPARKKVPCRPSQAALVTHTTTFQCLWHLRQYAESLGAQHRPHTTSLWAESKPRKDKHTQRKRETISHPTCGKGTVRCGRFLKSSLGWTPQSSVLKDSPSLGTVAQSHSHRASPAPVYHCSGGGTARAPGLFTRPNAPPCSWWQHILGNVRVTRKGSQSTTTNWKGLIQQQIYHIKCQTASTRPSLYLKPPSAGQSPLSVTLIYFHPGSREFNLCLHVLLSSQHSA